MIISWILTIIFLIVIICEIYFLGAYIAITQDIFHNKTLPTFALGALFYFLLTILFTFPVIWFNLDIVYYAIIVLFKDFFTIIFLVIQRDKFYDFKTDRLDFLTLLLAMIILPIFYVFALSSLFNLEPITTEFHYEIWHDFSKALVTLTQSSLSQVQKYIMYPIVSGIIYACIASLYLEFSRKNKYNNAITTLLVTLMVTLLFNLNIPLYDASFIGFYAFMFLIAYQMIIHSRRRFGILFGMSVFVLWTISNENIWPLTIISIAIFTTYLVMQRPRPSVFFFQLISPVLVIWALNLADFSLALSIIVSIIAIILYALIVIIVRIKWIEKANRTFAHNNFRFIFTAILFFIIIILNIVIGATNQFDLSIFYQGNEIFNDFNDPQVNLALNIAYYVILILIVIYILGSAYLRAKFVNIRLVTFIVFMLFLLTFNPFVWSVFNTWLGKESYMFFKCMTIMPLFIVIAAKIQLFQINRNRQSQKKYFHKQKTPNEGV